MKISARTKYGTRLMVELADKFGKGPIFLKDVAKREGMSEKYLSQLVIPLKAKGLLTTYRGAHGGYVLSKPPAGIRLKEIVEALEGGIVVTDQTRSVNANIAASAYVMNEIWNGLGGKIAAYLDVYTLEDLVRMRDEKSEAMSMSYNI